MVEKNALELLDTIINKAPGRLVDGGLELSDIELALVEQIIAMGLGQKHA